MDRKESRRIKKEIADRDGHKDEKRGWKRRLKVAFPKKGGRRR